MDLSRTIIALLIALSVVMAPLGSASASSRAGGASHAQPNGPVVINTAQTMAGMDMPDCAKMKHASSEGRADTGAPGNGKPAKSDCPCCEKNPGCVPELCLFKCVQMLGALSMPAEFALTFVSLRFLPGVLDGRPDWLDGPQPPPPRA